MTAEIRVEPALAGELLAHEESNPAGSSPPTCPHCLGGHVHRHGFYKRKDGSRPSRFLCRACKKSFNPFTKTPLAYAKKREEFRQFTETMGSGIPLRRHAAEVGVHLATAFRWRHLVLAQVAGQPQSKLTGQVAVGEAYVGYSQKGQRAKLQCARRFIQRLPSRILLIAGNLGHRLALVGAGRSSAKRRDGAQLGADLLGACLSDLLHPVAQVYTDGLNALVSVCRRTGLTVCDRGQLPSAEAKQIGTLTQRVQRIRASFHGWLMRFYGVATRYLHHYLAWYDALLRTKVLALASPGASAFSPPLSTST